MIRSTGRRLALFFITLVAGLLALLAFRSLAAIGLAAVLSGLSAQVLAGTSKATAATVHVHGSAVIVAFAGSLMLYLRLSGRSRPERVALTLASFLAAYFGGLLASELWDIGPGGVGVAGTVSAYLVVPLLDAARVVIKDTPWLKRLIYSRVTGDNDAGPACATPEVSNADNR
ncbi:hypothetical protein OL229_04310 [Neisseriaceae bacterium JH1-16]|nr:hypothetical protein [Neisseriaceae bacterium JH1-16]